MLGQWLLSHEARNGYPYSCGSPMHGQWVMRYVILYSYTGHHMNPCHSPGWNMAARTHGGMPHHNWTHHVHTVRSAPAFFTAQTGPSIPTQLTHSHHSQQAHKTPSTKPLQMCKDLQAQQNHVLQQCVAPTRAAIRIHGNRMVFTVLPAPATTC